MSNGNQLSLVVLDQRSDVVQSVLDHHWLLLFLAFLLLNLGCCLLLESFLLFLARLWLVLEQELEEFLSYTERSG